MVLDDEVGLGGGEAGDGEVERGLDLQQMLRLDGQDLAVPAGILGKLVVGQDVGPSLGLAQMLEAHRWHVLQPQELCRFDPAVTGDDPVLAVDQHRIVEPELIDAVGDLAELTARVRACVALMRMQL